MKVKSINIDHDEVMALVEGLSATVGQHVQGEQYDFEALWASEGDIPKLDIYYNGAVSALKAALKKKIVAAGTGEAQQKTAGNGEKDETVTLQVHDRWRTDLLGLLQNMCEEYVAYAVFAGWMSTFSGIDQAKLYSDMAEADMVEILSILEQRSFGDANAQRGTDGDNVTADTVVSAAQRGTDGESMSDDDAEGVVARKYNDIEIISHYPDASERQEEEEKVYDDEGSVPMDRKEDVNDEPSGTVTEAENRKEDADDEPSGTVTEAENRKEDADDEPSETVAEERKEDDDEKGAGMPTGGGGRHDDRDTARVRHHRDRFDLSGESFDERWLRGHCFKK